MEDNHFFLDRNNINSSAYSIEGDESNHLLGPFKNLNFVTGANSSGKSRFIRNIFSYNQIIPFKHNHNDDLNLLLNELDKLSDKIQHSEVIVNNSHNSNLLNNNEKFAVQYFFINEKGQSSMSINFNLDFVAKTKAKITEFNSKLLTQASLDDLTNMLLGLREIISCIQNKKNQSGNGFFLSVANFNLDQYYAYYSIPLSNQIIELISIAVNKLKKTGVIYNQEKIYIPIIRYSNQLFSDWNNRAKEDPLHVTIRKQYHLENFDSATEKIFTGQNLLKEIVKYRNGRKEQMASFTQFERFLSLNFFENKEIDLVANIDLDNINNNKITFTIDGNEKSFFNIGDGIQSIIILLFPIFTAEDNTWIFIEEPENSLHPLYQRLFIETLLYNEFLNAKKLKYYMTTHSNHILDSQFWESENTSISLFRKQDNEDKFLIKTYTKNTDFSVLKELGVLNSSVFIGNSAIWVEGITDRLYTKKLIYLYLDKHKEAKQIKENYDFVFFEYAGSNIAHYVFDKRLDTSKKDLFIQTNKLANKVFLIADYDLDDKGKKIKKEKRHDDLKKISEDEIWFKYYNTEPRKEIENIISTEILALLVHRLIPDQNGKLFTKNDFKYEDYKSVGLGEYLVQQTNTKNKIETESGTLSTPYKNKLANLFFENEEITWDMLSKEAQELTKQLIDFIGK